MNYGGRPRFRCCWATAMARSQPRRITGRNSSIFRRRRGLQCGRQAGLGFVERGGNTVSVLLGNGDGTLRRRRTTQRAFIQIPLRSGTSTRTASRTWPWRLRLQYGFGAAGQRQGTFAARTDFERAQSSSVAIGDFNADGKPDLVTANVGQHGFGAAGQRRRDVRGKDGLGTGSIPVPLPSGTSTRMASWTWPWRIQFQHGFGAAGQRQWDVRGKDGLPNGQHPPIRRDRGLQRRRQAGPGRGEHR